MSEHRKLSRQFSKPGQRRGSLIARHQAHRSRVRGHAGQPGAQAPNWISVAEELPQSEGFVLVYVDVPCQSGVVMAFWDGRAFWEHNWPWTLNDVTHWMPSPVAPCGTHRTPAHEAVATAAHGVPAQKGSFMSSPEEPEPKNTRSWVSRVGILLLIWTLAFLSWSQVPDFNKDVTHFRTLVARSSAPRILARR